ncbi:sensor histidine kinase [Gorillibacterium sp. sgz5001074]|uniref:sensor histidine kinase n=1 Tax=Gorillibacterium sp. sgz5001074 TaxID=3446695 RepID=UPI003F673A78
MRAIINRLFHRRYNFSTKLILILVAVNLGISGITGLVTYRVHLRLFNEELSRQYGMQNQQILARLDSRIKDMYRITEYIIFNPMVKKLVSGQGENASASSYDRLLLENELEEQLRQVRLDAPEIVAIRIYDLNENMFNLGTYAGSFQQLDPVFLDETIEQLKGTSGEYIWRRIGEAQFQDYTYKNWVLAARLMRSSDLETYGAMLILFNTSLFEAYLKDLRKLGDTEAYLYDSNGALLYNSVEFGQEQDRILPSMGDRGDRIVEEDGGSYLYTKQISDKVHFELVSRASLGEVHHRSQLILKVAVISAIGSIILFWLIITIISRRLLSPLKSLVKAMTLVRTGKFDTRVDIRSSDELGFIGDRFNQMTEQIDTLIREVYQRELSEKEAELKAIQAQLNPHFLYNALGMFFWKFYGLGDEKSAQLVNSLSEMLHYSLEPARRLTTLRDELKQIDHYLSIQRERHKEVLTTEIEVPEELYDCQIIRLLIQPIVENAFVHAFRNKKNGHHLTIRGCRETVPGENGAFLVLDIQDNGCGMSEGTIRRILQPVSSMEHQESQREGIGLSSVVRRIELIHGQPYGIQITSIPDLGTKVRLRLPDKREWEGDKP